MSWRGVAGASIVKAPTLHFEASLARAYLMVLHVYAARRGGPESLAERGLMHQSSLSPAALVLRGGDASSYHVATHMAGFPCCGYPLIWGTRARHCELVQ